MQLKIRYMYIYLSLQIFEVGIYTQKYYMDIFDQQIVCLIFKATYMLLYLSGIYTNE